MFGRLRVVFSRRYSPSVNMDKRVGDVQISPSNAGEFHARAALHTHVREQACVHTPPDDELQHYWARAKVTV